MKLHYYADTDSLYIELCAEPSVETQELRVGVNMDLTADGRVVGFDIDQAAKVMDLSAFEMIGLPFQSIRNFAAAGA